MSVLRTLPCLILLAGAFAMACVNAAQAQAASTQDCRPLIENFNRAVDAGQESEAQEIVDRVAANARCGHMLAAVQRRLAAFRLSAAQALMARGRPVMDFERLLIAAEKPNVLWQASATLAEVRFGERRFAEAALAFDRAIEIVNNEALTPTPPSRFDIESLIGRSAQARLLAANASAGQGKQAFVKTARNQRDGRLGGIYSPSVRGIVPRAVPIPITFEFAQTKFTEVGELAARELAVALGEQSPAQVVLVGHTDIRGTVEFNMQLSRERAERVANFLRENGVQVPVRALGKGPTEPLRLYDTSGLSQDDIYALNRRVEWHRE